jgi:hypothetical protein
MLRVIVRGKFSPGLICPDDISIRRGIFPWRPGILALFKKRSKIKKKQVFSTETKEQY